MWITYIYITLGVISLSMTVHVYIIQYLVYLTTLVAAVLNSEQYMYKSRCRLYVIKWAWLNHCRWIDSRNLILLKSLDVDIIRLRCLH